MALPFSADEIFAMAEQIERNGVKFYRRAAEAQHDSRLRQMLLDLADWEQQHVNIFTAMRAELAAKGGAVRLEPGTEADLYLRALADGRVFDVKGDPSGKLTGDESPGEILRTAIGLEKDSIVFYVGMKEMVSSQADKDRVGAIIREEMRHVSQLDGELGRLKPQADRPRGRQAGG